jgi:polysaccharide deacetylase 2 family uncharacterized protein YibQ
MRASLAAVLSRERKIPYLFCKNSIDGINKSTAVAQISKIIIITGKTGTATVVAEINEQTVRLIREKQTELKGHGIEYCTVSELVSIK